MTIAITDTKGTILALYRMTDGTLFSADIAINKARNTLYFSDPISVDATGPRAGHHPLYGIVPAGTAITCRTLGFLSQPHFPPTIDSSPTIGPLYDLVMQNALPSSYNGLGFAPPSVNQAGVIFFPGSAPLYRNGALIGAIGVSGDGVEQDDLVTFKGIQGAEQALGFDLEPPPAIRCDAYTFQGVSLPYMKFPQNPGG
jgi:uncharacterized protein GlcG (DUF336 family)